MEKERKQRFYSIAFVICLVLFVNSIPFSLFIDSDLINFIINVIIKISSIFYIIYYINKEGLNNLKLNKKPKVLLMIPLFIICFSNFFVAIFQKLNVNSDIDYLFILSQLLIAILTGIIEELLFRGLVFQEFLINTNKTKAIIYSSLIFGGIHLLNISSFASIPQVLVQVVYSSFLGFLLAISYLKTENIIVPIIFHTTFNFINNALTVALFNIKWDLTFYIVNVSLAIIIGIYALLIMNNTIKERDINVT